MLIKNYGCKCNISGVQLEARYLQIDHRIPYLIQNDAYQDTTDTSNFMLLSASINRAKSWSCEHCENWISIKDPLICKTCYWAYPENYKHVAMQQIRRLDIIWQNDEVSEYEALLNESRQNNQFFPDFVKEILRKHLK